MAGLLTYAAFRLAWLPALTKVSVKDFVAGILAFSALGFGAATAATILALSIPRGRLYLTMIVNGKGAPRAVIRSDENVVAADPTGAPLLPSDQYGAEFRSYYGDLIFVFLWTMASQLAVGAIGLLYLAVVGDLNMVDQAHCVRSRLSFFVMATSVSYAMLQMGSLIRAIADYARNQEQYDRRGLGL
ncbi:hypothetical protein M3G91_30125 [Micromonospora chalcea]|uniref:hypothetical protein n=1 Tax=Micromonospora chalcea TaxID=1874 RepID=UPI0021A85984|nr:hypothetical protein [Micromonospora chalcea]MCT2281862.1 hypothetical protein [Micromonospora chalcea]